MGGGTCGGVVAGVRGPPRFSPMLHVTAVCRIALKSDPTKIPMVLS